MSSGGRSLQEVVRTAVPADIDDLATLVAAAVAEKRQQKGGTVWDRRERRQEPFVESLRTDLDAFDREVAVGQLDRHTLGYGVVHVEILPDGGRLGVIDELYVEPRARELGLGEMLMEHLLEWCRRSGCFGVDSLALPGDRSTKNFFESFGLVARAIVVHRSLT